MSTHAATTPRQHSPTPRPRQRVIEVIDSSIGLEGFLAVDSVRNNMAFGGLRIDPSVTRSMVSDLSRRMSLKLAPHGAPVGGAKAGLKGSPTDPRLHQWIEVFARRCAGELHNRTVLGKDMGATDEALGWLYRSLGVPQLFVMRESAGRRAAGTRIRELRGYRRHMTALGIAWSAGAVLGDALRGRRVLIQGFGAVGAGVAVRLSAMGAVIVGVSDRRRAIYHAAGMPCQSLLNARTPGNELDPGRCSFPHEVIPRDRLTSVDADLLVLAAGSYLVDATTAAGIRCPLVIEGANIGLRECAQAELHRRGVTVVPDVIANSTSAALVGHQLAAGNTLTRRAVWTRIRTAVELAVHRTLTHAEGNCISSHQAFVELFASGDR